MSRHTGKSDFEDWCEMHNNPTDILKKGKVYINNARIHLETEKDLIPYYTHLIASMYSSPDSQIINLSKDSFIDSEEREFISWRVRDVIAIARKAKKEKAHLDLEYFKAHHNDPYDSTPDFIWNEIIDRIYNYPEVIKMHLPRDYRESNNFLINWIVPEYFYGIHDPMHNRYREEFIKFAGENGFSIVENMEENYKEYKRTDGEIHPMINHMCWAVRDFYVTKNCKWDERAWAKKGGDKNGSNGRAVESAL